MRFVKDEEYRSSRKTWIDYFVDNFKQEKEGSRPTDFDYTNHEIPHSFFTAVDVYSKNRQFLSRYLVVVIRNGDTSKNIPETYENHLDGDLENLSNPVGGAMFSKGIAVLFVDDDNNFKNILVGHNLRISS